ncbi:hypothetical protein OG765_21295 [Streptomyces sp. NBC_00555]|uniref:hypothetical protein n=1 Tax=Streptomyces sp. NBC_00555 TaxID=2903662 RepID=UPI00224D2BF0|nr:hypothetical protein [Streptomyces sp. NBC_00555]MCX5013508.1 hypothetical protein [Streptomyces sp. NBC_00555]
MNERTMQAAHIDLLTAVVAALDVPLPSIADADERLYHRLLERRMSDVRVVLAAMVRHGGDPWENASEIRRRTAEVPVTYTPFEFTQDGADR